MSDRQRISVIGLGLMGSAIARSLLRAGHEVTVWNRTHSKAQALVVEGAAATTDLADAVTATPVSLWCLLDYPMMTDIISRPPAKDAVRGRTVIPSATGSPGEVQLLGRVLEPLGATLLDAKIMFFPGQAGDDDAELVLAGSEEAFAAYGDLLRDVAGESRYLGADPTAASVLYTAVWAYDFAARFAYMESAALVEASGLDLDDFEKSAARRTAQFAHQNSELSGRFTKGDFDGDQATVEIYAQGMAPMLSAFSRVGIDAHMLESVRKYADAAERAGHGSRDVSVIFEMLRGRAL